MNNCEEALNKIINGKTEAYITCGSLKNAQESLRVQTFNARKKLPKVLQDMIGIAKIEEDGILYIKVYKREQTELYERDPQTGKLVRMKEDHPSIDAELIRIIDFMKADGKSQEEINAYMADWNKQNA